MSEQEQTIVRSVAVATISSQNRELGKRIQAAMSEAVNICSENGISTEEINTPVLKACMEAARKSVRDAFPLEADSRAAVQAVIDGVKKEKATT